MRKIAFYNAGRNGTSLGTVKAQFVMREVSMIRSVKATGMIHCGRRIKGELKDE